MNDSFKPQNENNLNDINNINPPATENNYNLTENNSIDIPTNLENMSYEDAKEYVVSILAVKKKYDKDIEHTQEELIKYERYKKLDAERGGQDQLVINEKITHLEITLHQLKTEEMEVSMKLDQLKDALKNKTKFQASIDTASLLDNLEKMTGKSVSDMKLEKETNNLDMESKLAELKRKMNQNPN